MITPSQMSLIPGLKTFIYWYFRLNRNIVPLPHFYPLLLSSHSGSVQHSKEELYFGTEVVRLSAVSGKVYDRSDQVEEFHQPSFETSTEVSFSSMFQGLYDAQPQNIVKLLFIIDKPSRWYSSFPGNHPPPPSLSLSLSLSLSSLSLSLALSFSPSSLSPPLSLSPSLLPFLPLVPPPSPSLSLRRMIAAQQWHSLVDSINLVKSTAISECLVYLPYPWNQYAGELWVSEGIAKFQWKVCFSYTFGHWQRLCQWSYYYPGQKKTATTIMHKIRTLFLSWDIDIKKSSLIALRCAAMREVAASRATELLCQSPDHADIAW